MQIQALDPSFYYLLYVLLNYHINMLMQLHLLIFNFLSFVDSYLISCILSLITFVMNDKTPIELALIQTPNI
jgi:hypothetical protein